MNLIIDGAEMRGGDFAECINGDFQEPAGIIQKRIIYSVRYSPFPREIARLPPVVPGIILSMIVRNEGVMAWLGYPTPAG